jgi:putative oxidoreductase
MRQPLSRWLAVALRLGLGAIFLYAGWAKLGETRIFAADIVRLQLVPFRWAESIATILPITELLTGAWLFVGWRLRAGLLAAMLLAALFAFSVGQAMFRGLDFNCHCFGVAATTPSAPLILVRALLLFGLAAYLRWLPAFTPED